MSMMMHDQSFQEDKINTQSVDLRSPLDRPKYGNMLVLYDNKCLLTLGPDYWCFAPTFLLFLIISILLIKMIVTQSQSPLFILSSFVICGGTCLAYLAVALSNPGIVTEENCFDDEQIAFSEQNRRGTKRMCKKCGFRVKGKTYHCRSCNVCVEGYDHHCPWTSKCIGKGNLVRFYIFLVMVPIFMIYIFVAFATVMSKHISDTGVRHIRPI